MLVVERSRIEQVLAGLDLLPIIEDAFVGYSAGRAIVPPVGELLLERGEVHIKYGAIAGDDYYVIKIASGFYDNPSLGLPSSNGMMLVFRQDTGEPEAVLLDEGHLTDVRTAVAGAVAARHLAPQTVERIGVLGSGTQARLQVRQLAPLFETREVVAWGRSPVRLDEYRAEMAEHGFEVAAAATPADVAAAAGLIVTTTPSTEPLLQAADIRPGTHISAIGSDTPDKQELAAAVLALADVVVADSLEQCRTRGEIARAVAAGAIASGKAVELGRLLAGEEAGRTSADQVSVFDSTGVAVQDIAIATAVMEAAAAE
ncbi:MAG: ornithine cyclodeaminase family protein [Chloroflexota bacterium]|jgi:ornithine cyclodeaminase